ncbi:hypothetical protein GALL_472590 [mine drainage metagenome]|uniref:Uncharacterized protein n=1 Tax=mine drainage metagenome TaxID=410659 RepID=A0A1J5PTR5_9ZZZZ
MKTALLATTVVMIASSITAPAAWAQSLCESAAGTTPVALVERFISADCAACWSAPVGPEQAPGTLTLDWIVPGAQGDDAPLSAAARRDALMRLESLKMTPPETAALRRTEVVHDPAKSLRVANGVAVGDYMGAEIELKTAEVPASSPELSAWLVLIEKVAAGTQATPVARNLVRNVHLTTWVMHPPLPNEPFSFFHELRPLTIPPGARVSNLRVVGWLQDSAGRVFNAAESLCPPPEPGWAR